MDLVIAAMVVTSAIIHPFWNLLQKKQSDPQLGYLCLTVVLALCALVHALAAGSDILAATAVLPLIMLSWGGQIFYGMCLTLTLSRGDLSAYYPIIRSSPVFIVVVGVSFLGYSYSWHVLAGIAMAVAGGFLLLYRRGTDYLSDPKTLGLSLLAMSGTGIYSIADSQLMQTITPEVQMLWVEMLLIPVYLGVFLHGRVPTRISVPRLTVARLTMFIVPGVLAYASYYLILLAFKLGGDVAAVTSVRQASIPISVLLGGFFLREGAILRRLFASLLLAVGIVVIIVTG